MKYLSLLFITFLISCGPSQKEELQVLKDEVIAIHDEVMPKMGELRKTRKALEAMADSSLMVSDSTNAQMYSALASDIAKANEGMMQWMRAYEPEFEGSPEEIKQYLEDQKAAVQKVKEDMNNSLAKGQEVLENY